MKITLKIGVLKVCIVNCAYVDLIEGAGLDAIPASLFGSNIAKPISQAS